MVTWYGKTVKIIDDQIIIDQMGPVEYRKRFNHKVKHFWIEVENGRGEKMIKNVPIFELKFYKDE